MILNPLKVETDDELLEELGAGEEISALVAASNWWMVATIDLPLLFFLPRRPESGGNVVILGHNLVMRRL